MAPNGETRIQLCGRLVVRLEGRRVDDALPGVLGHLLFAYLVLNRLRRIDRAELLVAVYGDEATPGHRARLSVLLSKVRRATGPELLVGRAQLELALPQDAFVDLEAAVDALHRAESHSRCRRTRSSTSRRLSTPSTGPSRTSRRESGRRPGGRRALPTTSPAAPCFEATTGPGSTIGGGESTRCG